MVLSTGKAPAKVPAGRMPTVQRAKAERIAHDAPLPGQRVWREKAGQVVFKILGQPEIPYTDELCVPDVVVGHIENSEEDTTQPIGWWALT